VLQRGIISFTPELPNAKLGAIQRLRMGNAVKVLVSFSRRFWPEDVYDVVCTDTFVPELWMTQHQPTDSAHAHLHCVVGEVVCVLGFAGRPDRASLLLYHTFQEAD